MFVLRPSARSFMYQSPKPYPYISPVGVIFYVPPDNPYMLQAQRMIVHSGCAKQPVGAVLVKDGRIIGRGANGFMRSRERHPVCERLKRGCKTGEGYELCPNCVTDGHAETMVIADARAQSFNTTGADMYLFGHWWCCEPCWNKMTEAGIHTVYLLEQATELFDRLEGTASIMRDASA